MPILSTDQIDLLLDSDGEIDLTSGGVELSSGIQAVAQGIRIAILFVQGEWFLNLDEGVPWFENDTVITTKAIMGQRFDEIKVLSALRTAILGVPGVLSIAALGVEFNGATRGIAVTWRARTEFGDTAEETTELS